MNDERADTERLDYLQGLLEGGNYTRRCVLRWSTTGRGFRLHETSREGALGDVRAAIDVAMDGDGPQKEVCW